MAEPSTTVTELRCNVEIRQLNCPLPVFHWQFDLLKKEHEERLRIRTVVSTDIKFCSIGVSCFFLWAHQLRYDMFLHLGRLDFAAVDSDGMQWAWGKGLNDQCKRCKQICWWNKGHQGSCGGQRGQLCRNLKLQDRNLIAIFDVIVFVVAKP